MTISRDVGGRSSAEQWQWNEKDQESYWRQMDISSYITSRCLLLLLGTSAVSIHLIRDQVQQRTLNGNDGNYPLTLRLFPAISLLRLIN